MLRQLANYKFIKTTFRPQYFSKFKSKRIAFKRVKEGRKNTWRLKQSLLNSSRTTLKRNTAHHHSTTINFKELTSKLEKLRYFNMALAIRLQVCLG